MDLQVTGHGVEGRLDSGFVAHGRRSRPEAGEPGPALGVLGEEAGKLAAKEQEARKRALENK